MRICSAFDIACICSCLAALATKNKLGKYTAWTAFTLTAIGSLAARLHSVIDAYNTDK